MPVAAADWWEILPLRCSGRAPLGQYFLVPKVTCPGKAPVQPTVPSICASRGLLGSRVTPALHRGMPRAIRAHAAVSSLFLCDLQHSPATSFCLASLRLSGLGHAVN